MRVTFTAQLIFSLTDQSNNTRCYTDYGKFLIMQISSACWCLKTPLCSFIQPAHVFNTVMHFSSACWYFEQRYIDFFSLLIFSTPWCSFLQPADIFNTVMHFSSACWYFQHRYALFVSLLIFSTPLCTVACRYFQHHCAVFFSLLIFSIRLCTFRQPADIFNTVLHCSLPIFSTPLRSFLQPADIFNTVIYISICWYFQTHFTVLFSLPKCSTPLCSFSSLLIFFTPLYFSLLIFSKQIIQWFQHKINGQEYNFSPQQIYSTTLQWFMPKTHSLVLAMFWILGSRNLTIVSIYLYHVHYSAIHVIRC
jgi:hypothetical protein